MKMPLLYLSWLVSTTAFLGSMYFSQILNLPPCSLCWWQRIFMFPLPIIYFLAFIKRDLNIYLYTFPLVTTGFVISIFHNLLYYGFIEKSFIPCSSGVSCTTVQLQWLGFITIPFLSLIAFTFLFIINVLQLIKQKETK